ncbi:hypothetical protein COU57_00535 [Candidatus Pacearchaeota archaeon CG10_big_fil_rev_8_21_14_0_10_32_14]|nr:MAG: hypothetical protein COU57_00535 [Candidatus Pacearchaeota archaeon CG10_big_fil_rev_8_21_14_0_10_32_14]
MEREIEDKLRNYDSYIDSRIKELKETIDSGRFRNSTNRITRQGIEALEEARDKLYKFFPELKPKE